MPNNKYLPMPWTDNKKGYNKRNQRFTRTNPIVSGKKRHPGYSTFSDTPLCFMPDQLISMADGTLKQIIDIKVGDLIKGWDEKTNSVKHTPVNKIQTKKHNDIYELHLKNGKILKPTGNHPFLSKTSDLISPVPISAGPQTIDMSEAKWTTLDGYEINHAGGTGFLKLNDYVYDIEDGWVEIVDIIPVEGEHLTYNFVDMDTSTIIADNIVTHNTGDDDSEGDAHIPGGPPDANIPSAWIPHLGTVTEYHDINNWWAKIANDKIFTSNTNMPWSGAERGGYCSGDCLPEGTGPSSTPGQNKIPAYYQCWGTYYGTDDCEDQFRADWCTKNEHCSDGNECYVPDNCGACCLGKIDHLNTDTPGCKHYRKAIGEEFCMTNSTMNPGASHGNTWHPNFTCNDCINCGNVIQMYCADMTTPCWYPTDPVFSCGAGNLSPNMECLEKAAENIDWRSTCTSDLEDQYCHGDHSSDSNTCYANIAFSTDMGDYSFFWAYGGIYWEEGYPTVTDVYLNAVSNLGDGDVAGIGKCFDNASCCNSAKEISIGLNNIGMYSPSDGIWYAGEKYIENLNFYKSHSCGEHEELNDGCGIPCMYGITGYAYPGTSCFDYGAGRNTPDPDASNDMQILQENACCPWKPKAEWMDSGYCDDYGLEIVLESGEGSKLGSCDPFDFCQVSSVLADCAIESECCDVLACNYAANELGCPCKDKNGVVDGTAGCWYVNGACGLCEEENPNVLDPDYNPYEGGIWWDNRWFSNCLVPGGMTRCVADGECNQFDSETGIQTVSFGTIVGNHACEKFWGDSSTDPPAAVETWPYDPCYGPTPVCCYAYSYKWCILDCEEDCGNDTGCLEDCLANCNIPVGCPNTGDLNNDGGLNILDIVTLVNCVLAENCADQEYACAGDLNQDGGFNVLDVVALVNWILAEGGLG